MRRLFDVRDFEILGVTKGVTKKPTLNTIISADFFLILFQIPRKPHINTERRRGEQRQQDQRQPIISARLLQSADDGRKQRIDDAVQTEHGVIGREIFVAEHVADAGRKHRRAAAIIQQHEAGAGYIQEHGRSQTSQRDQDDGRALQHGDHIDGALQTEFVKQNAESQAGKAVEQRRHADDRRCHRGGDHHFFLHDRRVVIDDGKAQALAADCRDE